MASIPIDHRTYKPKSGEDPATFGARLKPGDPVEEMPGYTWQHTGSGWAWTDGGQNRNAAPPLQQAGPYPGGAKTNTRPDSQSAGSYTPAQLPATSFQGYRAQSYTPYQFNQAVPDAYSAGAVNQFTGPQQAATADAVRNAVMQALGNPGFGQTAVDQMKAAHKEGAVSMQQQLQGQLRQNAASRGTLQGGAAGAIENQLGQDTVSEILRGYRDIDIAAADRASSDRLAAIAAGDSFLTGEMDRSRGAYLTGLEGQMAQESLHQEAARSGLDRASLMRALQGDQAGENRFAAEFGAKEAGKLFDSQFDIEDAALRRALAADDQARFGAEFGRDAYKTDLDAYLQERDQDINRDLEGRRLDIQNTLGQGGLGIDRDRLMENARQFDQGYLLDMLSFLENQRQFNRRLGFDYSGLQLGANQDFFNSILRG